MDGWICSKPTVTDGEPNNCAWTVSEKHCGNCQYRTVLAHTRKVEAPHA